MLEKGYQNKQMEEKVQSMKNYLNKKEQLLFNYINELDIKHCKEHQFICNWNLS